MLGNAEAEEPPAFDSLPADLLCSVAEKLDTQSLASFAAACSACRAVAHEPLGEALLQVLKRCLSGVRIQPWSPDRPHFTSAWETETFKGCGKNLKLLLLGNLTGVTSVGDNAFRDCSSLSKCVLPSGLVIIGTGAFERCTSLAELTLPATLTSIGESALTPPPARHRLTSGSSGRARLAMIASQVGFRLGLGLASPKRKGTRRRHCLRSEIRENRFNCKRCRRRRNIQGTLPARREADIHTHSISAT